MTRKLSRVEFFPLVSRWGRVQERVLSSSELSYEVFKNLEERHSTLLKFALSIADIGVWRWLGNSG